MDKEVLKRWVVETYYKNPNFPGRAFSSAIGAAKGGLLDDALPKFLGAAFQVKLI